MNLYRADKKGNKTLPEKYCTDGLFTKQLDSGDHPEPHKKYGWFETIKSHIHPEAPRENFIYDTSQYLSFTEEKDRALYFLSHGNQREYIAIEGGYPDAYIFTAEILSKDMEECSEGIFLYSYNCNYNRIRTDPKFKSHLHWLTTLKCNICDGVHEYKHQLLLIDAKQYFGKVRDKYPAQYENAVRDSEWLLMPLDPMVDVNSRSFQSRIQIADFWTVDFYRFC